MRILMPADDILDVVGDFFDALDWTPSFTYYRNLIDRVKFRFGVSRYAAKKRLIEMGYNEVRGVYEYCLNDYVEDYEVESNFPEDQTYTLPLKEIVPLIRASEEFKNLVLSNRYIYIDGHICLNNEKYVYIEDGTAHGLTEYAKHHMQECCIAFKRIYDKPDYNYTYGELNKEALSVIEHYTFSEKEKSRLIEMITDVKNDKSKLDEAKKQSTPLSDAVKYHMKRCSITSEELMERSGLGSTTITELRKGKKRMKLETILAFCVALELEKPFREGIMKLADVHFDPDDSVHCVYMTILELMPYANMMQINDFLISMKMKPWTQERALKQQNVI